MKTEELNNLINKKQKELDKLVAIKRRNKRRIYKYYQGKFVKRWTEGINLKWKILPRGLRELGKYNIEFSEKGFEWEYYWDNPGISYTPGERFCMICHAHDGSGGNWQYGIAPRFMVCSKHADFNLMDRHLKKNKGVSSNQADDLSDVTGK